MNDNLVKRTEYLSFYKYKPYNRKTPIYHIRPVRDDFVILGEIKWYGPFRKFTFYPEDGTVFDDKCLLEIVDFLNTINKEWKDNDTI